MAEEREIQNQLINANTYTALHMSYNLGPLAPKTPGESEILGLTKKQRLVD